MIHHLKGTVTLVEQGSITLDVAGVGFCLTVPHPELYSPAEVVRLFTYFHWNQETGPALFGFTSDLERQVFMLIISCSGIGPKIAISILQQTSPQDFLTAITLADTKKLSSLKGIGLKKAETLILHLQDKVKKVAGASPELQENNGALHHVQTITDVLSSLNYTRHEIQQAIAHLKHQNLLASSAFDELVRASLGFLAKTKSSL